MNHYQEITLLPDAESSLSFLWQKIYQQVHIALVEHKVDKQHSDIAVSFPDYGNKRFPFGAKLRLFAETDTRLQQLDIERFLLRFSDYVHIKSIQMVPSKIQHVSFIRQHVKGAARIEKDMQAKAELWAQKSGKSLSTCLAELEKTKPSSKRELPFIWMESQETKQKQPDANPRFPLFVKKIEATEAQAGYYSCYGFSVLGKTNLATVPWFS